MSRAATRGGRWWPAVVALLCSWVLVGCSATPPQAAAQGAAASTAAPPGAMAGLPGAGLAPVAGEAPADVALKLEALLGQHSVLVADMMRSRIRNDEDFAQATSAAVARNTDDLTAVVGSLFGRGPRTRSAVSGPTM